DPEKFKEAMPWQTTPPKNKSESKLSEDGQSLPPFHGRCRCTLVMTEIVRESVSAVENNSDKILDLETPIVDNANNKTNGNIPEAKTIEEANELAVNLGIAKRADFSGLDISAVNELIVGVMNAKNLFPELETLDYVGSMQKMIRNWKHYAQAYAITSNKNPLGIGLNIDKLSIDGIINSKKNLVKDVASKFRPIGCETIKAIIDHEIGHLIDFSLNVSKDKQIIALFRSCKKLGVEAMENSLSCYSNTNIREFIAEAWGEYQNNKSPRPIAKIVGQRLLDLSKERRQTKNDDES
ncbi:MAG: hypothetical protein IJP88_02255, partial [Synergistaceae bacterium]|nr:hypothetical protein [Synergistaceae bacterium]